MIRFTLKRQDKTEYSSSAAQEASFANLSSAPAIEPSIELRKTEAQLAGILAETIAIQDNETVSETNPEPKSNFIDLLRWYALLDTASLMMGFFIALWIAASIRSIFFPDLNAPPNTSDNILRTTQYFIIGSGVLFNLERKGCYRLRMPFWLETQKIIGTLSIAMALDGFLQFASKQSFTRIGLVLSWALTAALMIMSHAIFRRIMRRQKLWQISTLLVGSGDAADRALAAIQSDTNLGYTVTSQIKDLKTAFDESSQSWEKLCAKSGAHYVVVALDGIELANAGEAIAQLMREDVAFSIAPPLRQMPVFGMMPQYFFNHDILLLTRNSELTQPIPRFLKRGFDLIASSLSIILLSPLFIGLAIAIKRDGGPIFYGHKRIGYQGKSFLCLKFRTMVVKSDEVLKNHLAAHPEAKEEWLRAHKLRNDPRVTLLGNFLRRYSLDELPQLINVLFGQMSLVGPRPIVMAEVNRYNNDIVLYYRVRPGITGLWQVSGRSNVSYAKRVHMDSWYVRNWSLWHDVAIICKTFPILLKRTGAF